MKRLPCILVVLSVLIASFAHAAAPDSAAPKDLIPLRLPMPGYVFANTQDDGGAALIDPNSSRIVLYPKLMAGSVEGAIERQVGQLPVSFIHKRAGQKGYFLVACAGDSTLYALDEKTLEPVKIIHLSDSPCMIAAPSDSAVPFAYYTFNNGPSGNGVRQIDLRTLAETSRRIRIDWGFDEIAFSANGQFLYARAPNTSPSGFRSYRLVNPEPAGDSIVVAPIASEHRDSQPYVADWTNTFTACGPKLYTADLQRELATLPAAPLCFLPERPVMLAIDRASLLSISSNTFDTVGSVSLPALPSDASSDHDAASSHVSPGRSGSSKRHPGGTSHNFVLNQRVKIGQRNEMYRPSILFDRSTQTALLCQRDRAIVVPLGLLHLPDEPFVAATVEGDGRVTPGQSLKLKIVPANDRVKVSLERGPKGMRLQDNQLLWTPSANDIGTPEVTLALSAGAITRDQSVPIEVSRPFISLPFLPTQAALSADGSALLVAGQVVPQPNEPGQGARNPKFHIAVVDLKSGRITADREIEQIPAGEDRIALDSHYAYMDGVGADLVQILDRKDLREVRQIFTTGRPERLVALGGDRLFVQTNQGPIQSFSVPELKPLNGPAPLPGAGRAYFTEPAPIAIGQNWLYQGVLWGPGLKHPILLVAPKEFLSISGGYQSSLRQPDNIRDVVAPWGTRLNGGMMQRTSGQQLASAGNFSILLTSVPAAVSLDRQMKPGSPPRERIELQLHELVSGQQAGSITLSDEPVRTPFSSGRAPSSMPMLQTPAGQVLAAVDQELFVIPAEEIQRVVKAFPVPLHFIPKQSVFLIDPEADTVLKPAIAGGRGQITFADAATGVAGRPPDQHVEVDPSTGQVTIHAGAFNQAIAQVMNSLSRRAAGPGQINAVDQYCDKVAPLFKRITGRAPQGVPLMVTLGIVARDADQQAAIQEYTLLIDVDLNNAGAQAPGQPAQPATRP